MDYLTHYFFIFQALAHTPNKLLSFSSQEELKNTEGLRVVSRQEPPLMTCQVPSFALSDVHSRTLPPMPQIPHAFSGVKVTGALAARVVNDSAYHRTAPGTTESGELMAVVWRGKRGVRLNFTRARRPVRTRSPDHTIIEALRTWCGPVIDSGRVGW